MEYVIILLLLGLVIHLYHEGNFKENSIIEAIHNILSITKNNHQKNRINTPPKKPYSYRNPNKGKESTVSKPVDMNYYKKANSYSEKKDKDTLEKTKLQAERSRNGGYRKASLLNGTEKIAKVEIISLLQKNNKFKEWRLLWQVCMGEFLDHPNKQMYGDINLRRVDFLIVGKFDEIPIAAIEIHGQGHYPSNKTKAQTATLVDMIKRRACESAGIKYISIAVGHDEDVKKEVRRKLEKELL